MKELPYCLYKGNKIIFLRHAETEKDSSKNASLWSLSEKGEKQANNLAKLPIINSVDLIFVSEEQKTSLTAKPIAKKLVKNLTVFSNFNEVKRGDKFLTKEEFESEKIKQLEDLDFHAFGGESGNESLKRFNEGVEKISKGNRGKTILIVTHGTVLNIYFANILDVNNEISSRWKKTDFCAYGVIENGKILKDIVE